MEVRHSNGLWFTGCCIVYATSSVKFSPVRWNAIRYDWFNIKVAIQLTAREQQRMTWTQYENGTLAANERFCHPTFQLNCNKEMHFKSSLVPYSHFDWVPFSEIVTKLLTLQLINELHVVSGSCCYWIELQQQKKKIKERRKERKTEKEPGILLLFYIQKWLYFKLSHSSIRKVTSYNLMTHFVYSQWFVVEKYRPCIFRWSTFFFHFVRFCIAICTIN